MSAGGNAAKVEAKYLPKRKQFSRVTISTDSYGIVKRERRNTSIRRKKRTD